MAAGSSERTPIAVSVSASSTASQATAVLLTLVTDEVDAWYERLSAHGVAVDAPPREHPHRSIHHCICQDPNGYRIWIQRFLNLAGNAPADGV